MIVYIMVVYNGSVYDGSVNVGSVYNGSVCGRWWLKYICMVTGVLCRIRGPKHWCI